MLSIWLKWLFITFITNYKAAPIAGAQLLLDYHNRVLFEIAQLYYQLEFDHKACMFSAPVKIWTADRMDKFQLSLNSTI